MMAARINLMDRSRTVNGETYEFGVYIEHGMIHIVGRGDCYSTGEPASGDPGDVIVESGITTLLERGTVQPGKWDMRA